MTLTTLARGMQSLASNPEALASFALLAVYFALFGGRLYSIDGFETYQQALSIVVDRSIHLRPFVFQDQTFSESLTPLGGSLAFVPTLWVLSWLVRPSDFQFDAYHARLFTIAAAPVFAVATALSAALVARLIRILGYDQQAALWGLLLFGAASPALVYARGDFAQPLEGLYWIAALCGTVGYIQTPGFSTLLATAAAVFLAIITRPVEGMLLTAALLCISTFEVCKRDDRREMWHLITYVVQACCLAALATLLVNALRYGHPFLFRQPARWTTPLIAGLAGSLISPSRGILWSFPAVLIVPIGVTSLWRRDLRGVAVGLAALVLVQLLIVAKWAIWWGGLCWGLRIFYPALPVLAVLVGIGANGITARVNKFVPWTLFAGGLLWALPCVIADLWTAGPPDLPEDQFLWHEYPPIGIWKGLRHVFATHTGDSFAVDILWFRLASETHYLSLIPAAIFLILAVLLTRRLLALMNSQSTSHSDV